MQILNNQLYTFDDVLLEPQFSDVKSRAYIDLSTSLSHKLNLKLPIISANMDTVTEGDMAVAMHKAGGLGILHRFASSSEIQNWLNQCYESKVPRVVSHGISDRDFSEICYNPEEAFDAVCIDVAHADNLHVHSFIRRIRETLKDRCPDLTIIAGNVATCDAAFRLAEAGADIIKCGIGPGSICSTRIVTGHGVPQLSAIMNVCRVKINHPHIKVIADGGIRNSGDIVKALAAGADAVMVGSLLAGTEEAPGKILVENGLSYKTYRGMASYDAQKSVGKETPRVEGVTAKVPYKGPVKHILEQLEAGIRSGFSYSGANTLKQLQLNSVFLPISGNTLRENSTHINNRQYTM